MDEGNGCTHLTHLTGTVSYYTVLQLALWAVFHVAVVFLAVVFPLYNQELNVRKDQVHPHHNGATGSNTALCASCSYFWHWRIFSQRHTISPYHLSWERQRSHCVLTYHCREYSNCNRHFSSDNRVQENYQGKVCV